MKIKGLKLVSVFFLILLASFLLSTFVLAQEVKKDEGAQVNFEPQVTFDNVPSGNVSGSTLADYIKAIYRYGVILGSSLAIIVIMVGGIIWLTSGGSPDRVKNARTYIGGAIAGLVLLLGSYLLLQTINPSLVNLTTLDIKPIKSVGTGSTVKWICCGFGDDRDTAVWVQSENECTSKKVDATGGYSAPYSVKPDDFCIGIPKPYIEASDADAGSPAIKTLVACIESSYGKGGYTRQQYVDSNIGKSCLGVCKSGCSPYNSSNNTGCHHACTSDHYGCKCGGQYSYAVDLSTYDSNVQCALAQAASDCSKSTGISIKEMRASKKAQANCSLDKGFGIIADGNHENHIHIAVNCQ